MLSLQRLEMTPVFPTGGWAADCPDEQGVLPEIFIAEIYGGTGVPARSRSAIRFPQLYRTANQVFAACGRQANSSLASAQELLGTAILLVEDERAVSQ